MSKPAWLDDVKEFDPTQFKNKRPKYESKKNSWKFIQKQKAAEIRKQRVRSTSDIGRPSLNGFKKAKSNSISYQEYAIRKTKIDGLDRGF
jgi:hypothetical protein